MAESSSSITFSTVSSLAPRRGALGPLVVENKEYRSGALLLVTQSSLLGRRGSVGDTSQIWGGARCRSSPRRVRWAVADAENSPAAGRALFPTESRDAEGSAPAFYLVNPYIRTWSIPLQRPRHDGQPTAVPPARPAAGSQLSEWIPSRKTGQPLRQARRHPRTPQRTGIAR